MRYFIVTTDVFRISSRRSSSPLPAIHLSLSSGSRSWALFLLANQSVDLITSVSVRFSLISHAILLIPGQLGREIWKICDKSMAFFQRRWFLSVCQTNTYFPKITWNYFCIARNLHMYYIYCMYSFIINEFSVINFSIYRVILRHLTRTQLKCLIHPCLVKFTSPLIFFTYFAWISHSKILSLIFHISW